MTQLLLPQQFKRCGLPHTTRPCRNRGLANSKVLAMQQCICPRRDHVLLFTVLCHSQRCNKGRGSSDCLLFCITKQREPSQPYHHISALSENGHRVSPSLGVKTRATATRAVLACVTHILHPSKLGCLRVSIFGRSK